MSFDAVRIGASGLNAAQKAIEVTSNNIANASNEKYTRQRVVLANIGAAVLDGGGVRVLSVTRARDIFADATWRSETGTAEASNRRADILARAEAAVGPLNAGLTTLYDEFFTSWNQLSLSPNDPAAREAVLNAANNIAQDYNRLHADMAKQAIDARTFADGTISEVNALLDQMAGLNSAITQASLSGTSHNELLDTRDSVVDRLSVLVGATLRYDDNGLPTLSIGGYQAVTGSHSYHVEVRGDGTSGNLLRLGAVNGGDIKVTGGQIGGAFTGINTDLAAMRVQLDSAAMALKTQVNAQQALGFDATSAAGVDMFAGTGAGDIAIAAGFTSSQVAAGSTPAYGDGNNALAMAKLRQDNSPTSAMTVARSYVVNLGAAVDGAVRTAQLAQSAIDGTTLSRQETQGVNIDEELVELIRYQRAYQAVAKAISVADEVLGTLVNGIIR